MKLNKNILIINLGNRDLQINQKNINFLPIFNLNLFDVNSDDKNYLVIKKTSDNFLKVSEILFNDLELYTEFIEFPLISRLFDYLNENNIVIEKIIVCSTKQKILDKQDTYYLGLIFEKFFSHLNISIKFIENNPNDFSYLANFYTNLIDEFKIENIFVFYSSGTPIMRSSFFISGFFREDIEFLELNSRSNKISSNNYLSEKNLLLKDKIYSMLNSYSFEGIKNLPVSNEIKNICEDALESYNFEKGIDLDSDYGQKGKNALKLLWSNLYISFIQGRYSDVIGRLFRIEEQCWYFLFYKYLKNKTYENKYLIDENDKFLRINTKNNLVYDEKFEKLISKRDKFGKNFFLFFFSNIFEEIEGNIYFKKEFDNNNKNLSVNIGKNFYYYYFKSLNKNIEVLDFFKVLNLDDYNNFYSNSSKLNEIRNSSINGHGFKGISKADIEKIINEDLNEFIFKLKLFLEKSVLCEKFENIFDIYVEQIKDEVIK